MIRSSQTYECDNCREEFDLPVQLTRIRIQKLNEREADVVDLCQKCVAPVASVMKDFDFRRGNV